MAGGGGGTVHPSHGGALREAVPPQQEAGDTGQFIPFLFKYCSSEHVVHVLNKMGDLSPNIDRASGLIFFHSRPQYVSIVF